MQIALNAENVLAMTEDVTSAGKGELALVIDLSVNQGLTSTGKSVMVAKTGGWQTLVVGGVKYKLNLNLVRPLRQSTTDSIGE